MEELKERGNVLVSEGQSAAALRMYDKALGCVRSSGVAQLGQMLWPCIGGFEVSKLL